MKVGQYVRCPIVVEENDEVYPRSFVLGKIIDVNELSEEVKVRLFDIKNSARFYAHAFDKTNFPKEKVYHCAAAKNAPVKSSKGKGHIVAVCDLMDKDLSYEYYIMLFDGNIQKFSEEDLEIEYSALDYSPLEQMKQYEFQNPTWYANRLHVSANMHMVSNTIYGFQVLAGCRTYLMSHQISTIVRAFETKPIRYLLADEVGLGKTIEACSIIKILATENQNLRVLYLVPSSLANQWDNELKYKFSIQAAQNLAMMSYANHFILPLEVLDTFSDVLALEWDLLLVDETHRLLSSDDKYNLVLTLSKKIQNVLFLSATPIQDRQEEYLRLLSLLQPNQYCSMNLKEFSYIVSKQKTIQRRVNAMLRHMNNYEEYKEDTVEKLEELAEVLKDKHLVKIIGKINLDAEDSGMEAVSVALSYITENYRIERKMMRSRRDYISENMAKRVLEDCSYEMLTEEENYNERNTYFSLLQFLAFKIENSDIGVDTMKRLLGAMFSSPWALENVLKKENINDDNLLINLGLWKAQAEEEISDIDRILDEQPDEIKGRLLQIIDYIEQEIDIQHCNHGKTVIFAEYLETLEKLEMLLKKRGIKSVSFREGMSRKELDDSVYDFQNSSDCRVILCDATGGEGRNFQIADWIILADLPWNANDIEQRIGRLDRLGRESGHMEIHIASFYSQDTIEEQLFTIWNRGMNLFRQSLSGLEIIAGELNNAISESLLTDVYNGLENALDDIIEMAEDARDAVEEEQLYDSANIIYRPLSQAVEQMLKTYQGGEDNLFQNAMLGWSYQAGLKRVPTGNPDIIQFGQENFSLRAAFQSLLVPPNWDSYQNTSIVRRERKILGTFDRGTAIKREDLLFFAPGDSVFESIIGNAMDNGRGRCCAFEATASFEFTGFLFIYNVEPDESYLLERNIPLQLLSQFRMYLPMEQIYIYIPLNEGSKGASENELNLFIKDKKNIMNAEHLGSRKIMKNGYSKLEKFILSNPEDIWADLVERAECAAHKKAMKRVGELSDIDTARKELIRIVNGYESECIYLDKDLSIVARIREQYKAVLYALKHCRILLDSASLMRIHKR